MALLTDPRLKRLLYQSNHRGTKEADKLIGGFARACLADLSPAELDGFEALLDETDRDLFDWITGRAPVPADRASAILDRVIAFNAKPRPE